MTKMAIKRTRVSVVSHPDPHPPTISRPNKMAGGSGSGYKTRVPEMYCSTFGYFEGFLIYINIIKFRSIKG
jgi:hypothetical protein